MFGDEICVNHICLKINIYIKASRICKNSSVMVRALGRWFRYRVVGSTVGVVDLHFISKGYGTKWKKCPSSGRTCWALMGLCGAKCEVGKVNYRALSRAKHSIRLFWPKFGFWALKENFNLYLNQTSVLISWMVMQILVSYACFSDCALSACNFLFFGKSRFLFSSISPHFIKEQARRVTTWQQCFSCWGVYFRWFL